MVMRNRAVRIPGKKTFVIGIDEAGRGPLAGPVAAGAFAVRSDLLAKTLKTFSGVRDSKQLTEKQREALFETICSLNKAGHIAYVVSFSSEVVIDRKGISHAVRSAVKRCLKKLVTRDFCRSDSKILLDGLLHAPKMFPNQKTIIGGDESEPLIALASICAKVVRDRKMKRIGKCYPGYGFEIHKGYGTRLHLELIRKLGILPIHRKSYIKSYCP